MSNPDTRAKLLLVDDYVPERDLYETILGSDFHVLTAARGLEAVALADTERPDVVVLDVMMPGIDGWATCVQIKSNPVTADTPVILLTGSDDVDLSRHAMAVGADAIVTKPCRADKLMMHIRQALDKRAILRSSQ